MDATTQFEDIHHSKKADEIMKELYIGDFDNPDADGESWEDYIKRKQKEEENQLSFGQKAILLVVFVVIVSFLYSYLTGGGDTDK